MSKQNKSKANKEQSQNIVQNEEISKSNFFSKNDYITIILILLFTFIGFMKVGNYEFVNWDDDRNVFENKHITQLNKKNFWDNTAQIFKSKVIGNYNPLTIWSFALEQKMHSTNKTGMYNGIEHPGKFHTTNLLLHLLCVLFSYLISRRLGLKWLGAGFVAALFAIHPMRVESVAWVTERKDVLFGVFYLAALFLYIKQKQTPTTLKLIGIFVLFVLSLFSKIQAVSLPLSFIAVDYLLSKELTLKSVINKWPYFLISLAFGIYGLTALDAEGSLDTNANTYAVWQRLFVGSYSYLIYLVKFFVPYRLSPLYPYDGKMPTEFYPTILMLPITLYALWQGYKKSWHVFVFSLVFFIVNIVFLLQILGAGQGFLADRFTYIAYLGLFFGLGYLLDKSIESDKFKIVGYGCASVMLLAYFYVTTQQINIWENSATLWSHVLKYYDKTTLPFGNRANYYRSKKMYKEAIADYNSAINLRSEPQTHNSRARLYFDTAGNDTTILRKALYDYDKAIELLPKDGEFWINRGATYARLGNIDKAIENINQGLIYKPDHETGYLNRFILNLTVADRYPVNSEEKKGYLTKALTDMETYQKFRPYEANTYYETARLKRMLGKIQEAKKDITLALQMDPKDLYKTENAQIDAALKQ